MMTMTVPVADEMTTTMMIAPAVVAGMKTTMPVPRMTIGLAAAVGMRTTMMMIATVPGRRRRGCRSG